ncbi:MAG: hypothetical protein K6E97_08185 [Treponema sp.]|nr:hypothetical protein [Treponema sp.]
MKRFIKLFFILNMIFAFISCTFFYGKDADLSYQSMFDLLWEDYNETYALFEVRNVDWNAQYNLCKPMIREDMTDAEFFEVLKTLLYPLNDAHVYVKTPFANLNSGEDQTPIDNFSLTEVCSQYIQNPKKCGNRGGLTGNVSRISGRFCAQDKTYAISRTKDGKGKNEFDKGVNLEIKKNGSCSIQSL